MLVSLTDSCYPALEATIVPDKSMLTVQKLQRLTRLSLPICEAAVTKAESDIAEALDSLNKNQKTMPKGAVGLFRGLEMTAMVYVSCGKGGPEQNNLLSVLAENIVDTIGVNQQKLEGEGALKRLTRLRLLRPFHSAETVDAALKIATAQLMSPVKIKTLEVIQHRPNLYVNSYLLKPMSETVGVAASLVSLAGEKPLHPDWELQLKHPITRLCQQILLSRPISTTRDRLPANYLKKVQAQTSKSKYVQNDDDFQALDKAVQKRLVRVVLELQPALFDNEDVTVGQGIAALVAEAQLKLDRCTYVDSRWKNQGMLEVRK